MKLNKPSIYIPVVLALLLLISGKKKIKAKGGGITFPDYALEKTGNVMDMPSGTGYKENETIGVVIPQTKYDGEVLIQSAKNKNIYHLIPVEWATQFTTYKV